MRYTDPDGRDHGMSPDKEREMKQRDVMVNGKTTAKCGLTGEAQRIMTVQAACSYGTTSEIRQTITDNTKRTDTWGVYAIKSGVVIQIQTMDPNKPLDDETQPVYGNNIIIKTADGMFIRYAHLETISCNVGTGVEEGAQIGIMGDTGRGLPGPNKHLHVSVYPSANFWSSNAIIDPMDVIREGTYPCNTKVSGLFHQIYTYTKEDGTTSSYPHEGLDCSGKDVNLIKGWNKGLNGQEALNAQGY